jgi:hypothetical protein
MVGKEDGELNFHAYKKVSRIQYSLRYLVLDYPEISINWQIGKDWSDTVVWYDQLLYCLHLLQGVRVQCLEYFIFVMEGAGKKQKNIVNDKDKSRSLHEVARHTKIHIKHNILMSRKLLYLANLWSQRCQISQILLY